MAKYLTPRCDKCGKKAPVDKKRSNKNWTAYPINQHCECGGVYRVKVQED